MKTAFTLVEILVCVAIITVLLAVLLPILSQSKQNAYKATCQSNLKTVWHAVRLYVDDYDGTWPDSQVWTSWNSSDNVFPKSARGSAPRLPGCPKVDIPTDRVREIQARGYITGYAYNTSIDIWNDMTHKTGVGSRAEHIPTDDKDFVFPATTVLFFDAALDVTTSFRPDLYDGASPYPYNIEKGFERHNGGGNYLFYDGHVEWLHKDQVRWGADLPKLINDGTLPSFALNTVDNP